MSLVGDFVGGLEDLEEDLPEDELELDPEGSLCQMSSSFFLVSTS